MGNKRIKQLTILIVLFSITSVLVYFPKQARVTVQKTTLKSRLSRIDGYHVVRNINIEDDIYKFLDLDDYIFADYLGQGEKINLFVGFYTSASKISAAHSPLACFPGQGWTINQPAYREINVNGHEIRYAEIIASREDQKELVLYWYQAGKKTTPYVYLNKINAISNKIFNGDEQHAFVRVTVSLADSSYEKAEVDAIQYIQQFYPEFLEFLDTVTPSSS